MPVPPPFPDPTQIEARLLSVAEMLDAAVAEVRRTMAEIKEGISDIDARMLDLEGGLAKKQDATNDSPPPGSTSA